MQRIRIIVGDAGFEPLSHHISDMYILCCYIQYSVMCRPYDLLLSAAVSPSKGVTCSLFMPNQYRTQ